MAPSSPTDVRRISDLKQIFFEYFSLIPLEHRFKAGNLFIVRKPLVELLPLVPSHQRQKATELLSKMPLWARQPEANTDSGAKIDAVDAPPDQAKAKVGAVEKESPAKVTGGAGESAVVDAVRAITNGADAKAKIDAVKAIMKDAGAKVKIEAAEAIISSMIGAEAKMKIEAVEAIIASLVGADAKLNAPKPKVDAAAKEAKSKSNAVEKELSMIVGRDALKSKVDEWVKGTFLDESRRALGLKVGPRRPPHMAFVGNPGTGKTIVARTLGKVFHMVGLLPANKVIEVQPGDLFAQYVNQTAQKTRAKIKEAEGGILFVHGGYNLAPWKSADYDSWKNEALEEIRSAMDSGKVVVIFAGNNEVMEHVMSFSTGGLRRKITNFFDFDDFTCKDLGKILHIKLSNADESSPLHGFKLHTSCSEEVVAAMIERGTAEKQRKEMNGGLVVQMLVKARENLDSRVGLKCTDKDSLHTITSEDLAAGLSSLVAEGKRESSENTCVDVKAKMDALEAELSKMVGMDALKLQLKKWLKGLIVDERCRTIGLNVGSRRMPHMVFLGNPGTGKTMVARVLAKLLHMVGIIPTNNVKEVQRTDLVAKYIGQTGPKTRKMIEAAKGGILFVDEAYRLVPELSSRDFGLEALEEIMSSMDSGSIVAIFAGYSEPMKRVISSNEGFKRRVSKILHFDDYSSQDLAKIVHLKMSNQPKTSHFYGFKLHPECSVEAIAALIEQETTQEQRTELNGGLADRMLANARENFDSRIDVESIDANFELTITLEDLAVGISDEKKGWLEEDPTSHFCSLYI